MPHDWNNEAKDLRLDRAMKEAGISDLPDIVSARDFAAKPIPPPPELVRGVLHKGSKGIYGGPSKSFKTWTLLDLGIAVATGGDWLGFSTTPGRVLYVNFELQDFGIQKRLHDIAKDRGVDVPEALHLWNLRGHSAPLTLLLPELLRRIEGEGYDLIVPDPIYKTLQGRDENAAGDVGQVCNEIEAVAVQTGAAVAFGAHFAKGNAAAKQAIDRISGSGVFARDPDSIITVTPHEEEDCFTVDMILRNFPPPGGFAIRWRYPRMVRDASLDPENLRQPGKKKERPEVDTLFEKAMALVKDGPLEVGIFDALIAPMAETRERTRELRARLCKDKYLVKHDIRAHGVHDVWIGTAAQIEKVINAASPQ